MSDQVQDGSSTSESALAFPKSQPLMADAFFQAFVMIVVSEIGEFDAEQSLYPPVKPDATSKY